MKLVKKLLYAMSENRTTPGGFLFRHSLVRHFPESIVYGIVWITRSIPLQLLGQRTESISTTLKSLNTTPWDSKRQFDKNKYCIWIKYVFIVDIITSDKFRWKRCVNIESSKRCLLIINHNSCIKFIKFLSFSSKSPLESFLLFTLVSKMRLN